MTLTFNLRPLKFRSSLPLVKYYRPAKFEKDRVINNREIADCAFSSSVYLVTLTFDLHTNKCIQLFCQLAKYEKIQGKMAEKLQNADSGKEIK